MKKSLKSVAKKAKKTVRSVARKASKAIKSVFQPLQLKALEGLSEKNAAYLERIFKYEDKGQYSSRNRLLDKLGDSHPAVEAYGKYLGLKIRKRLKIKPA